jgi:xylulokinase
MTEATVGIDIGTTSVKAIAADGEGNVLARARVPHQLLIPGPERMEHDATEAWRRGPRAALDALDVDRAAVRGVSVAAMVPSLAAVDAAGDPISPGLLYGDERGRTGSAGNPAESGELVAFLRWLSREFPGAAGFWPAQAVANCELGGEAVLDTATAATAFPLFDWTGWDAQLAAEVGARVEQLPRLVPTALPAGRVDGDGPVLGPGCIDALAEQLVAGADDTGDVLVILGTTLIVWAVADEHHTVDAPGLFTIPHTAKGKLLIGGPSNAGGLFLDWARRLLGPSDESGTIVLEPERVPVWAPYLRGERVPFHDHTRRASASGLDLTHDPTAVLRGAFEASAFCARRMIEASAVPPRRIVATGGGVRVDRWVQALADATGLPVDCVAVPEGGALGSAWLARLAAGLEDPMAMPEGRRWARTGRRVEPDPAWKGAVDERYRRFLDTA